MPDDPNKRGPQDRARISKQEHEQRYAPKRKGVPKKRHHPQVKVAGRA